MSAGQIFDAPIKVGIASQHFTIVMQADSLRLDVQMTANTETLSPRLCRYSDQWTDCTSTTRIPWSCLPGLVIENVRRTR